jgi:hypothetical protein
VTTAFRIRSDRPKIPARRKRGVPRNTFSTLGDGLTACVEAAAGIEPAYKVLQTSA